MKKYELKYTTGEDGVFRMSMVENPATKTQLVMFDSKEEDNLFVKMMIPHHEEALRMAKEYDGKVSKKLQSIIDSILTGQKNEIEEMKSIIANEINMEFQDDEKQVIYSVAMRPNMLILRKDINGEPAMVFYTEETIKDLQQNFFKNNSHNGATVNHDKIVRQDMYCFESWIVQDPEKDKATSLGLDVKKGDWVLGQKVDNPQVWQDIKDKKLNGFSIEAYLEPVLTNEEIEMKQEDIDKRVKIVLMESQSTPYVVGGKTYYIDKMEVGGKVQDAEGNPVPSAEIEIEKWKIKTDENGVIIEATQEIENQEDPLAAEEIVKLKEANDALTAENADLKAKITELESKQTNMSTELLANKKVLSEMAGEAGKSGIKPGGNGAPEKQYHEMSNHEKAKFNRGKL